MTTRGEPLVAPGAVHALLGPTNTGKTHRALERLLEHDDGVIGFPLRLLAREAYDRLCARVGAGLVALVTGEEKIIPRQARYFACTVEAMPRELHGRAFSFVAVDEIQLCADPDRGHIFTERLLHLRGTRETMVLGQDTIAPLLRELLPDVQIEGRPRFSTLSWVGDKKLARLPKRSAVVAFSIADVYAIAEELRRSHGGAAVVLGALSPRTRNAQVEMFQRGEVDVLVATDAIGMGLNLDIHHVAFAAGRKFDGDDVRDLLDAEIAQIAGRAGRHVQDGTFGVTRGLAPFAQDTIERVEKHRCAPLQHVCWRNSALDWRSLDALHASLRRPPPHPALVFGRVAEDLRTLEALKEHTELRASVRSVDDVMRAWEVCQIPDFPKVSREEHTGLLLELWRALQRGRGLLREDWLAPRIDALDTTRGDVEELVARVAAIRTWTYVAHKHDWIEHASHWQQRTRAIEDKVADALHERLTHRFVDRLARVVVQGTQLNAAVDDDGAVVVMGEHVGTLSGLRFAAGARAHLDDRSALKNTAAARALHTTLQERVQAMLDAEEHTYGIDVERARVCFGGDDVARIVRGRAQLWPQAELLSSPMVDAVLDDGQQRDALVRKLTDVVRAWVRKSLPSVTRLHDELHGELQPRRPLAGGARGVAYALVEHLGIVSRDDVIAAVGPLERALEGDGRRALFTRQVRLGFFDVFVADAFKTAAIRARALLLALHNDRALPSLPPPGASSVVVGASPPAFLFALGFRVAGARAFRADLVDEIVLELRALPQPFAPPTSACERFGCSRDDLAPLLTALGYARDADGRYRRADHRPRRARRQASG